MHECVGRGLIATDILPGSLKLKRRAPAIFSNLNLENPKNLPETSDWLSLYALAVNEENAAGHQVVTAPTNGAAGRIGMITSKQVPSPGTEVTVIIKSFFMLFTRH